MNVNRNKCKGLFSCFHRSGVPPRIDEVDATRSPEWKSALLALAAGIFLAVAGFIVIHRDRDSMGFAMFIVLPTMVGFLVAMLVKQLRLIALVTISVLGISMGFLLVKQWEGYVCCLMALPLLIVFVTIGAVIGFIDRKLFERHSRNTRTTKTLCIAAIPLLILGADRLERRIAFAPRREAVVSNLYIGQPPDAVWNLVKSIDRIEVPKPFLLRIGLPVPQRCELAAERAGATRTCFFNSGYIQEQITVWDPPRTLGMRITKATLPGRHWLHYESAEYELLQQNGGTLVRRTTTISSLLSPTWYWRPLERLGVEAEHEYLFAELTRRANLR